MFLIAKSSEIVIVIPQNKVYMVKSLLRLSASSQVGFCHLQNMMFIQTSAQIYIYLEFVFKHRNMAEVALPNSESRDNQNKPTKICGACSKSEGQLLRCSKCKKTYYCGQPCQTSDWPNHRKVCGKDQIPNIEHNKENTKTKQQKEDGLNEFGKLSYVGTGNFSIIFRSVSKKDGKTYAIKQVEKAKVQRMRKQADVFMEKHCLNKLKDCPYVIKLFKTFQDEISLYFQMQCPEKGQLWEISRIFGVIPNSIYKYYVSHIVKAVSTLHNDYQIVHRDLKPENILLDSHNRIKLIDFGTAKDLERPDIKGAGNGLKGKKQFEHYVGTAHYMAPECIHNKASEKKSDIYSLSGIFYFLKVGSPPFQGGSEYLTFNKSLETELFACSQLFDQKARDLIKKMNSKDMQQRIDINQVMKHPYFQDIDFQNLPTYDQSCENTTAQEIYLSQFCERLKKIMENQKQPSLERRKQIYQKEVLPKIKQQLAKVFQNSSMKEKIKIIDIQCQTFLNIRDNNNISFTQIYKETECESPKNVEKDIFNQELHDEKNEQSSSENSI